MRMSGNRLDKLNYLIVLAEEQSLTRAAKRLYISQPALTAYLNRLEKSLKVKLFDRSTTPIRLTSAGQLYLSEMQKIESRQNEVLETIHRMEYDLDDSLSIAIGRNRGSIWLPAILPEVYRKFPNAHIQITEDRDELMAEKVLYNAVDVAIIETFFYVGTLSYQQLPDEVHTLVTGYGNPHWEQLENQLHAQGCRLDLRASDPRNPLNVPVSFINEQLFICPAVRGALNYYTQQLFSMYKIKPKEITFIQNNITAYQLSVKGLGTTYLNTDYEKIIKMDEKPVFIMPGGKPDVRKIYAVYKERNMTELKRFFIEHTLSTMKKFLTE